MECASALSPNVRYPPFLVRLRGSVRASPRTERKACAPRGGHAGLYKSKEKHETELELTQSQVAQKLVLQGEMGVRALRVRSVSREEVWASAGVQGAWVNGFGCEAD